ncbi:MAG TPA: hypothetical protein VHM24_06435, partial [Gemmatimonadaceae bacterium]|nr:hypothetical protein [Gemmatimonadaceae bacterium]
NTRSVSYLVKPATAVRVRFAVNEPTPWAPEVPAGENPPPGAVIDYHLGADAGNVKLEIADADGKVIRTYSSSDTVPSPDPALNPEAYNRVCQRQPSAPRCSVPLYWAAPNVALSSKAGMHRFIWDMHYDPIEGTAPAESATGAVPHRTYYAASTPWAPPGAYTVRLTAGGRTYTQPLTLVLDPRVKTSASVISEIGTLSREMYDGAVALRAEYQAARAMSARLTNAGDAKLKAAIDSIAPPAASAARPVQGFRPPAAGPPNLESARSAMMSAAMSMQDADVAPTERELDAVAKARAQFHDVMQRWKTLRATERRSSRAAPASGISAVLF